MTHATYKIIAIILCTVMAITTTVLTTLSTSIPPKEDKYIFKLDWSSGDSAIIQPILPMALRVTRVKGENPSTTIFPCVIIHQLGPKGEDIGTILKCGTAEYQVENVVLAKE